MWLCIHKLVHESWVIRPVVGMLSKTKWSIWSEELFDNGHDKEHGYQDRSGNKAQRNRRPICLPQAFTVTVQWSLVQVHVVWSFGIKLVHSCSFSLWWKRETYREGLVCSLYIDYLTSQWVTINKSAHFLIYQQLVHRFC